MVGVLRSHACCGEYLWDVSGLTHDTSTKYEKGQSIYSTTFRCGSCEFRLQFVPAGHGRATDGQCSLFLVASKLPCEAAFELIVDQHMKSIGKPHKFDDVTSGFGFYDMCPALPIHNVVAVRFIKLVVNDVSMLEESSTPSSTLVQWARHRAEDNPHKPIVELYETFAGEEEEQGKDNTSDSEKKRVEDDVRKLWFPTDVVRLACGVQRRRW